MCLVKQSGAGIILVRLLHKSPLEENSLHMLHDYNCISHKKNKIYLHGKGVMCPLKRSTMVNSHVTVYTCTCSWCGNGLQKLLSSKSGDQEFVRVVSRGAKSKEVHICSPISLHLCHRKT